MNRKRLMQLTGLVLIIFTVLFLFACQKEEKKTEKPDPDKGIYNIYYKNADGTELCTALYQTETESANRGDLVKELLLELQSQKKDDPSMLPAVPSDLAIIDCDYSLLPYLEINFTKAYLQQKGADEILCRAALVMTLTQIPQVKYLEIKVEGQPLLDSARKMVGKMSSDNFLADISGNMFSRQKNTLLLYFASKDGNELVESERTVLNDNSMAMEKLVMKLLMEGPSDGNMRAVLPDTVSLLDISIRSGTCYVNFDSAFLTDTMDLPPNIIIYSIVNSLTELSGVSQVQIMVNGSSDVKFMDRISLSEPFLRDLNYLFVLEKETKGVH